MKKQLYYGSIALTILGCIGAVVTPIIAVHNQKHKKTKDKSIKSFVTTYYPSILCAGGTVGCIIGSEIMNKRQEAALMGAYLLLNQTYNNYKNQSQKNPDGKNLENKKQFVHLNDESHTEALFYDEMSDRYFESTIENVIFAEYHLNRDMQIRGYVSLNDFYKFLGISEISGGDVMGWSYESGVDNGYSWIDFNHIKTILDDGLVCYIITIPFTPSADYV